MHEETKPACLKRDEEHVQLLVDHISQRMTNPFNVSSHPKPLINISTEMHASREIETSLINSSDDGTKMAKTFVLFPKVRVVICTAQFLAQNLKHLKI
jgi:hypothetical protein